MKYKTIIFDFDGTLVDSLSAVVSVVRQLAKEFKRENLLSTPIKELRDRTAIELIKKFKVPFYRLPFLIGRGRKMFLAETDKIKLFPGMKELITKLNQDGYQLGILSSNSLENISSVLEKNRLEKMFDFIRSELNLFGKDKALIKIINQYRLDKSQTIYIGDEARDIEAAKKIGLNVVAVCWGFNSEKLLEQYRPSLLVRSPQQIQQYLTYNL